VAAVGLLYWWQCLFLGGDAEIHMQQFMPKSEMDQ
jgi:hypothetical protein